MIFICTYVKSCLILSIVDDGGRVGETLPDLTETIEKNKTICLPPKKTIQEGKRETYSLF